MILDAAVANGINLVDTANVYGRHLWGPPRRSSVAGWPRAAGGATRLLLATTTARWGLAERGAPVEARHHPPVRGIARRLRTDRIDLYQMHHIDREAWWDEIWEAMEQLKRTGKILCGLVELRRVAHRPCERDRRLPPLPRPGDRAVPLQPHRAHARARGDPRRPRVRHGPDLVQPVGGRPARRGALQGRGRAPRHRVHARRDRGELASSRPGRSSAPSWEKTRHTSRSRGCSTSRS